MTLQNKSNQLYGKTTQQDDADVTDIFDRYDTTIGEGRVADEVTPPKENFFSSDIEGRVHVDQTVTPIMQEAIFAQEPVEPLRREEAGTQERQWERELTATMRMQQDVAQDPVVTQKVMPQQDQDVQIAPEQVVAQTSVDAPVMQEDVVDVQQEASALQTEPQQSAQIHDDVQEMAMQAVPEIVHASAHIPSEEPVSTDDHVDMRTVAPAIAQEVPMEQIMAAPSVAMPVEQEKGVSMYEQQTPAPEQRSSYMPPAQQMEKPYDQPQRIDLGKKTIAIVDDDVDTREMYAAIFENADYNVIQASDGLEALSLIAQHTPHAIFTGLVMPRMDGFAMIEALKKNPRTADIPVIINSHLGRDSDKQRAEDLGVRDFIVRGFTSPREAVERVGAILLRDDYTFRFDINDPDARKLLKDLGDNNFFVCPRGQEMVLKLRISDPKNMIFSARFSCMDARDK